jgi:precorrin-3B C17-methyltransferase
MSGVLNLVSVGPGFADQITERARQGLLQSDAVVSYELYLTWIVDLIEGKEIFTAPLTQERERVNKALAWARQGKAVSLVSSGDIGIYAMATLAFENMREEDCFDVNVIPGITAATASASLLGAPLSHDFATLSLSDLLCPWDWIEKRARKIAEADLALVLYNVQSATRQTGVYKILDILLECKAPETLCGVVRNAYRPEQEVSICTLSELRERKFDMLTTVVIGNRLTERRRQWIFTPRGYGGFSDTPALPDLPKEAYWVFSGTTDGNQIANLLISKGKQVILSVATTQGAELARAKCAGAHVIAGKAGKANRLDLMSISKPASIIDATHPFATIMSLQLIEIAKELNVPYIRFERPSTAGLEGELVSNSAAEAASLALQYGKRIFLSTGSKELEAFLDAGKQSSEHKWFIRLTPDPEIIERAVSLGIPRSQICAMQGPFSQDFNEALWKDWQIDCVVTKESGATGGVEDKLAVAKRLNIPMIIIKRPAMVYPKMVSTLEEIETLVVPTGAFR